MRIIVTVPQKPKDKWKVSLGSGIRKRNSATTIYNSAERKCLASELEEKTCVRVNYGSGYVNESLYSTDARYLLYALACFLESYLPEATLKKKERRYKQN